MERKSRTQCFLFKCEIGNVFLSGLNYFLLHFFELDSCEISAKILFIFHVTHELIPLKNQCFSPSSGIIWYKWNFKKVGFYLLLGIGSRSFFSKKEKNKQSLHLPTKAREAHYNVHLLNIWQVEVELWGLCFNYKEFQMWRRAHKLEAELLKCLFFKGTKRVSICFSL